jgi:predicted N-acetyltransferase YhbS
MATVRPAEPRDAAAISECLKDAFEPYRSQYTSDGFSDTVLTGDAALRRMQQMSVLVAEDDGKVVGTIGYQSGADNEGHLRGLAVLHAAQGKGVAAQLMKAAEDGLRKCGCRRVTLDTTRPLTRAQTFYERRGYRPTGIVTDFFGMELVEYDKRL